MKRDSCSEVRFYLYGFYSEYSLKPIELTFLERQIPFTVIANLSYEQMKQEISKCGCTKILLTSAHPFIPRNVQKLNGYDIFSYSISDLRRLTNWKRVYFFAHDSMDEFKQEEIHFSWDYDAFFLKNPESVGSEILGVPVHKFPDIPIASGNYQDFDYIFFISEWDFYRKNLSPKELVAKFPFLLSPSVGLKPPSVPNDLLYLKTLSGLGVRLIPSNIRADEIIPVFTGIVITNSTSGVIKLGIENRKRTVVLDDFSRIESLVDIHDFIVIVNHPYDFERISSTSFENLRFNTNPIGSNSKDVQLFDFLSLLYREL